jgi:hypothetical protein
LPLITAPVLKQLDLVDPLLACMANAHESVRSGAAWVFATALQDNERLRGELVGTSFVATMMQALRMDASVAVRAKALSALSGEESVFRCDVAN